MKAMRNSHALVVGIAKYQLANPLPAIVVKDAEDVHALLIDPDLCGYPKSNSRLLLDSKATLENLRKAFKRLALRCTPDSTAFIYISGHGGRIETGSLKGEYIIPVECDPTDEMTLAATAMSGKEFSQLLRDIKAKKVLVVFDCCHAAGIGYVKSLKVPNFRIGIPDEFYEGLEAGHGRVIFASSRGDELSYIIPGDTNSLFTKHLLAGLHGDAPNSGPYIRTLDLYKYVQPRVTAEKAKQHTVLKAQIEEDFPIALYQGGHGLPATRPVPVTDFAGRQELVKELSDPKGTPPINCVLGITGIGKTTLIRKTMESFAPEKVFWYEFMEGMVSLEDIVASLSRFLSIHIVGSPNGRNNLLYATEESSLSIREKVNLIVDVLNNGEFYLAFDSIHRADANPGVNSFFQLLKEQLTAGKVFLTSQSKPGFFTPVDQSRNLVKVIELEGLTSEDTDGFFKQKGIVLTEEQLSNVDDTFRGMPLALELLVALHSDG